MPRSCVLSLWITSLTTLLLGASCLDNEGITGKPAKDGGPDVPDTSSTGSTPPSRDAKAADGGDGGPASGCKPSDSEACDDSGPTPVRCGNDIVEDEEECDDGNLSQGDGCSSACEIEPDLNVHCVQAKSEALPATLQVMFNDAVGGAGGGGNAPPTDRLVKRADLFRRFDKSCGSGVGAGCHVGTGLTPESPGLFQMVADTFDKRPKLGDESLARILSPNPAKAMPLGGGAGDERACDAPLHTLGRELKAFQDSQFADDFNVAPCPGEAPTVPDLPQAPTGCDVPAEPYLQPAAIADAQTNLGSCISPAGAAEARKLSSCPQTYLETKDAFFAGLADSTKLPDKLQDTDLVSLDSEVLLRHQVYSYSPTYTLFSDHAKKQRYFRVPTGKPITYNPETNEFVVPDNTRFYKTFLKPVTDKQGNRRFRKMETRIIVTRGDEVLTKGGFKVRALRGTYVWSQDERTATLVRDQLQSGASFADRLCPYIVDENVTRDPKVNPIIREIQGADGQCDLGRCTTMTEAQCEDPTSGKIRHYAIPGIERCDQCHMGSSNHSYLLGFNPWQVDRRAKGTGGVYEDPTEDELTQLQRLLAYGVIQGIAPGQVKLEDSQLPRKPRTNGELQAQAYMLGNCAFCHQPNGYPSVTNPELLPLNLWPKAGPAGGAFEFPLSLTSSRVKIGGSLSERTPYIYPDFGNPKGAGNVGLPSKVLQGRAEALLGFTGMDPPLPLPLPRDFFVDPGAGIIDQALELLGPWNSVIWRNVYTPFTYGDDSTIFVHMPRHVPGYDCRAHKIMAGWMLGLPVKTKRNEVGRDVVEISQ
ncbi:MAG: hypothetical protein RJA70_4590, partial [Pseudomonadota bacterium]